MTPYRILRSRRDERGSALVIVLVVLVGLTVLGAAGLALTEDDVRQSENIEASTEAFYAADAGLQRYMGQSNDGTSSASYAVGSVPVTVTPTLMGTLVGGENMYRLRAVATHTAPDGAATPRAVSALAIYKPGTPVNVTAALASGTGLTKNGGSGTISGMDQASLSDPACPQAPGADVAGVTVPVSPGYSQSNGGTVPDSIDYQTSGSELLNGTGIDWESLHEDGGGNPDYVVPPDAWPDFSSLPADEWPVVFVDGNATLEPEDSGRGTIIITGNLSMNGDFEWDGLILAGGYMTSNGYQTITGGTITGLNILLGESVPTSDIGNGNKKFLYNSCYVQLASQKIMDGGGMAMVPGSWHEEI
jgi:Tfp pilus assembly protein PilX